MVDYPDCHRLIINGHADRVGTDNRAVYLHAVLNRGKQVILIKQPDHVHVQGVTGFIRSNFAARRDPGCFFTRPATIFQAYFKITQ